MGRQGSGGGEDKNKTMGNVQCERCGITYNQNARPLCPCCQPVWEDGRESESERYFRSEVQGRKRIVNSYRRASVAKWEREHGAQIY